MSIQSLARRTFTLALIVAASLCTGRSATAASAPAGAPGFTYVIVHGAWGGGWAFREVERRLRADGHTVYRPTLTGQGERSHLANPDIDLSLHIQDVVNVILWEDLHEVVLVGHSYGGMVITGVADRVPDRIRRVIYLDAFLPENGESADSIRGHTGIDLPVKDGFIIPPWIKGSEPLPHDVPQPAKTFSEPIVLKNQAVAGRLPATYILTVDRGKPPEQDAFFNFYGRAKARGWTTLIMEGDHNVQWSHPKELVDLLESAPLAR